MQTSTIRPKGVGEANPQPLIATFLVEICLQTKGYQSLENYTIFFNPSLSVVYIFASIFEKIQFKDYIIASLNSSDSLITFKLL